MLAALDLVLQQATPARAWADDCRLPAYVTPIAPALGVPFPLTSGAGERVSKPLISQHHGHGVNVGIVAEGEFPCWCIAFA
jgi:hypothetical protein